ncbi:hypothetical protein GIB67_006394 [Kingdonia uniflora]|uniref:Fungal lipase-type domain-containing protein n=1 Tax=Kingdonia uniflora TaxID=39325 RepID=A0A7J7P1G5_9MAGN|nr:hypothetical protein GIB67_006394 [Kingdonia uniflora]
MACTSVIMSTSPVAASAKDMFREQHNCLWRSHSSKDLYEVSSIRRSQSDPQFRCSSSLNPIQTASAEPKLKKSHSEKLFSFQINGSVLKNSVQSLLLNSDIDKELTLADHPEEREEEKRANWVESLLELRSHWINKQQKGLNEEAGGDGDEGECEDGCDVDYTSEEDVSSDQESFSKFLVKSTWSDTKLFSKLAFLCNMAYVISELKAEDLWKYYDLDFATSSLEKKADAAIKLNLETDSTCVSISSSIESSKKEPSDSKQPKRPIRHSVAYDIAASAASFVHSRAKDLLALGQASASYDEDVRMEGNGSAEMFEEISGGGSTPRVYKSEVAAFVAASTMTAVVAAEEEAKQEAARDLRSLHSSPCEWFVCDDSSMYTRYFVIQGSDSLASWHANLFFEPTQFEGTEVLVHRGIYEAAKGIYEQFMPEIMSHLERYGDRAKFRFTGHSLGGSLSLLVNLMLLARGVVKTNSLLPVVTFGSPFVFCGGHIILDQLRLDESHIHSVIMHRDIVPRAFSCNYHNHVVQFLKRISATFRSHPCLNKNKMLYSPLGQLYILQPDEKSSPPHPLLPRGSALYALDKTQSRRHVGMLSALKTFLNSPHPLETLSDPTAYGSEGTILRDHDSSNYLKALNGVLRQQSKVMVDRSGRNSLLHLWPLLMNSRLRPHPWSHQQDLDNTGLMLPKKVVTGV